MAKMNHFRGASNSISLDALLGLLVIFVPVAMFFQMANNDNPFIDDGTTFVVLLMSLFLLSVMWLNRNLRIPILEIFILVYVLFWHLRFLTLTLFPNDELVLRRTVVVDHDIFNIYVWVVFISLIAAVGGIFIAHIVRRPRSKEFLGKERRKVESLNKTVKKNIGGIFIYCLISFFYQVYTTQVPEESLPSWFGYVSFFFPFSLVVFLVTLVLFNREISGKYKFLFQTYMAIYLVLSVLSGSRNFLMFFVLGGLFLFTILNKRVKFTFRQFVIILLLGLVLIFSFAYATYQRHMRSLYGWSANAESIQYVLERMVSMEDAEAWGPMIGLATARAGYLDFSAEMFSNRKYSEVVTIENILKSTIDGYIPGAVFEDSRLIAHRIIDIYDPNPNGYQSDAIGAVGENYILFGYAAPLAIAFVAFAFTYLFNAVSGSIFGIYIKFSVAIWFMTWWNSFGYDWLFMDIGRQLLFGALVIALIFRHRGDSLVGVKLAKEGENE